MGYLRELDERRTAVLASIDEQGKLTAELRAALLSADTKARVEDIYLPYKPKRRTKAQMAREAGLEPLADRLLANPALLPEETAAQFSATALPTSSRHWRGRAISSSSGRPRTPSSSAPSGRSSGRTVRYGRRPSRRRSRKALRHRSFATTSTFSEPLESMPSHRVLAVMRGEKEKVLSR